MSDQEAVTAEEAARNGKTVRIDPEMHRCLKSIAALRGMTIEALLAEIIAEALAGAA